MNKKEIEKKLLEEKNANLIDVLEIANNCYIKTLANSNDSNSEIKFEYFKIHENIILDLNEEELNEIKNFFETSLGNIVY